ncbi:MAG: isopenicillin N synthase family dioxygenase [Rhodospirillaceae bacterium]
MASNGTPPISIAGCDKDLAGFAAALGGSFTRTGFAVISDHGIPQGVIDRAFGVAQRFFTMPDDVKRRYCVPDGAGQRGYTPFGIETAKGAARADLKEFWHVGRNLPAGHRLAPNMLANLVVTEVPEFNAATYRLFEAMDALGLRILRGVAVYLGLAADFFMDKVASGNSILRLLHYPPMESGAVGVRAGAHEDINVITLLLGAEEAGLQLLGRDGAWRDIDPPPGCVVVNVGDMLQRLTNHVLPSTTHRVVNPKPERAGFSRYSLPFFQHFTSDFTIDVLPGCIRADRPSRYPRAITADAYLRERLSEIKLKA